MAALKFTYELEVVAKFFPKEMMYLKRVGVGVGMGRCARYKEHVEIFL